MKVYSCLEELKVTITVHVEADDVTNLIAGSPEDQNEVKQNIINSAGAKAWEAVKILGKIEEFVD